MTVVHQLTQVLSPNSVKTDTLVSAEAQRESNGLQQTFAISSGLTAVFMSEPVRQSYSMKRRSESKSTRTFNIVHGISR